MKKIVICSSVSAYPDLPKVKRELEASGFEVMIPFIAAEMEKAKTPEEIARLAGTENATPEEKRKFILGYFKEIAAADGVLVFNKEKHGIPGYVGANVLMELTVGLFLGKKLFLWNEPSEKLNCHDELLAMGPTVLNGELDQLIKQF
jgi:hypothetical protein